MSAEILRRAANVMRSRAEAADPSPWDSECPDVVGSGESWVVYAASGEHEKSIPHIASWHPSVALACADMLEIIADGLDVDPFYDFPPAEDFARAYLGEVTS